MAFMFGQNFFSMFRAFHTSQAFEELLDKEDTTLWQVLDQEDVIQEMKNGNSKLIAFLTPENISELLTYITEVAEDEEDEQRGRKFPFIANELLSCEVSAIMDRFFESSDLMDQLFGFYNTDETVNILLGGYVARTAICLLTRNKTDMIDHLLVKNDLGMRLSNHIYNKATSELLSRIIGLEDVGMEYAFLEPRLKLLKIVVDKLASESYEDCTHASLILCEILLRTEVNAWEVLIAQLIAPDSITKLFNYIKSDNIHSVNATVSVLHVIFSHIRFTEMVKFNLDNLMSGAVEEPSEEDMVLQDDQETPYLVDSFIQNLAGMKSILERDPEREIILTMGLSIKQLGANRIKIAELILDALKVDNEDINKAIIESEVLITLTQLFFANHWNSQIHNIYCSVVESILACDSLDLQRHILVAANLPQLILDCIAEPYVKQSSNIEIRKGQMGQVTKISNAMVKCQSYQNELNSILEAVEGWAAYIDGELNEQNELENKTIGGGKPLFGLPEPEAICLGMSKDAYSNDNEAEGEPLTMDDLENSPEKKDWEDSKKSTTSSIVNRSLKTAAVLREEDDVLSDGSARSIPSGALDRLPMPISQASLHRANEVLNDEGVDVEMVEYNSNSFWKTSYDVELEDLD